MANNCTTEELGEGIPAEFAISPSQKDGGEIFTVTWWYTPEWNGATSVSSLSIWSTHAKALAGER
jgi:hypothetical protein